MELLTELILEGLIVELLGVNTRFYFFKLIGKVKTREYLRGDSKKQEGADSISHHFINVVVGIFKFAAVSILIAYIVYPY